MALAMGSIMAVVAVLLNHIDRKEEVIIIPKISLDRKVSTTSGLMYYTAYVNDEMQSAFSPGRFHSHNLQDLEGDTPMKAPLLYSGCHH